MAATVTVEKYYLEFDDLSYSVRDSGKKSKRILDGISGRFRPGQLSAILGPSGAGKTTLMNVLAGFKSDAVQGTVKLNGVERDLTTFRQISCYITQEFSMFEVLTVRETLELAGNLKLGKKKKKVDREILVEKIASILSLTKTLDTRVNRISGGEKKRLSIGVELLTNPPIMFFDEPTSGLDSMSSFQVVSHLKSLAKAGRTVIMIIHQPSSSILELIDDVMILSGGSCLYNGTLNDLIPTFNSIGIECPQYYNRADFALEVACGERGNYIEQLVKLSGTIYKERRGSFYQDDWINYKKPTTEQISEEIETEINPMLKNGDDFVSINFGINHFKRKNEQGKGSTTTTYPVSMFTQFEILFKRSIICNIRDMKMAFLKIITHIIVALCLGAVYYNFGHDGAMIFNNLSCLFFMVIFIFYGTALHTVMTFPIESAAVLREHFNNWYPIGVYHLAKMFSDIPLQLICPTVFLMISYYLTGQPMELHRFTKVWLIGISLGVIAQTFGCIMGTIFKTQVALFLTSTVTMPTFLISGFFIHLSDLSPYLNWLSYISIFRYCLEGVVLAIYGFHRGLLDCSKDYCHYKRPEKFLQEMGMDKGDYWLNLVVLVSLAVVMQVCLYIAFRFKVSMVIKRT